MEENENRKPASTDDVLIRVPERFSVINRMILRDLNNNTSQQSFYLYSKSDISEFLKNPATNEQKLRQAVIYMYGASAHFRRLIQYFTSLSDLSYVVSPKGIDTGTAKPATVKRNYKRVLNLLSNMD